MIDLDAYNDWRRAHPTRSLPRDIEEQIVAEVTRLRLDVHRLRAERDHFRTAWSTAQARLDIEQPDYAIMEEAAQWLDQVEATLDGFPVTNPCPPAQQVAALRAEVADLRMQRDEHMIDTEHAHAEGKADERAAVVAWLRGEPERLVECDGHRHADGKPCLVMSPMPADELADAIERGEHRKEEEK
jgi:hypothetical protein